MTPSDPTPAPAPATPRTIPPWVRALGLAGLLPFIAGAAATWMLRDPVSSAHASFALAAYAATIAAFLGGVHWGVAMRAGGLGPLPLVWGVLPQLGGWMAMLLPPPHRLLVCAALLVACAIVDRRLYPPAGLAAFLPLRLVLTAVAVICCIVAAAAAMGTVGPTNVV